MQNKLPKLITTTEQIRGLMPEIDYGIWSEKPYEFAVMGVKGELNPRDKNYLNQYQSAMMDTRNRYFDEQEKIRLAHNRLMQTYAEFLFLWIGQALNNNQELSPGTKKHLNAQQKALLPLIKFIREKIRLSEAERQQEAEECEADYQSRKRMRFHILAMMKEIREMKRKISIAQDYLENQFIYETIPDNQVQTQFDFDLKVK